MAKVEPPMFILPKKRSGKRQNTVTNHVDHIITIQGSDCEFPSKHKNGLSPVSEHVANGIIHSTMEGLKSNMKINLPIITDVNDEELSDGNSEIDTQPQNVQKNGYQPLTNINTSREIIDLSPIYENSSDACSSHDDLHDANDMSTLRNIKLNSENAESSCPTPNSLSQTQSENSFEMGPVTDSLKNSSKRKKRVNIISEVTEMDNTDTEITAFCVESESSISRDTSLADCKENYLTMTGTIKRGKKSQNVDVKLNISREELEIIEAAIVAEEYNKMDISKCTIYKGPHILLFTILCIPFALCTSGVYSFYIGTMTWYNIFNYVTDLSYLKKVLLAPILILAYPFMIPIFVVSLGVYAAIVQITPNGSNWWKEVCDFEKGFYGWFCNKLDISECCPYEVVILVDVKP